MEGWAVTQDLGASCLGAATVDLGDNEVAPPELWPFFTVTLRNIWKLVVAALVLAAINQIFSLLDPLIFRHIIDSYATRYREYSSAQFLRGVSVLLAAAVGVPRIFRTCRLPKLHAHRSCSFCPKISMVKAAQARHRLKPLASIPA